MAAAPPLGRPTADHLLLLRRLRRLLLRVQSAQLLYLWGDDPRSLAWLQSELDRTLRARSRRLLAVPAASGGAPDVEPALRAVLQPERGAELFGIWVALGDARGSQQRDWLLARLNERRAGLLAMARPVLLVGRGDAELAVAMVAPDLWSIRSASFVVPAWALHAALDLPPPTPWLGGSLPSAPGKLPAVALWDRALASFRQAAGKAGGAARAMADDASPQLALDLGFDAIAQAVRYRQLALAERVLADLAAHLAIDPSVVGDQPQALRQTYQWRFWAAELAGLRRQWADALAHAQHALAAAKRLLTLTGESPEALRDWSISLSKVGDVQRALGDVTGARVRYEESLKVRERLVALTGESPEALRDLAISCQQLGDLQAEAGALVDARAWFARDLQAAEAALRQSLLSQDIQEVVDYARRRLAELANPPANTPP